MAQKGSPHETFHNIKLIFLYTACILIGAVAGARRGIACASIFGCGHTLQTSYYDTCADGEDCIVVECDGFGCQEGNNCGQFCSGVYPAPECGFVT